MDMGFQGLKFTWREGSLYQRLDRSICNESWQIFAPRIVVKHLNKLKSDHMPLLVSTSTEVGKGRVRPFRFLTSWLQHPQFRSVVRDSWSLMEMCWRMLASS